MKIPCLSKGFFVACKSNDKIDKMRFKPFLLVIVLLLQIATPSFGQQQFAEGAIVYKVSISNPAQADQYTPAGTYTIYLKGSQIRKELKLKSGYENITIINGGNNTVYSLKNNAGNNLAIQPDYKEFTAPEKKYEGFILANEGEGNNIASYKSKKGKVKYKGGSTVQLLYTDEVQLVEPAIFERYPGITVLPLSFEVTSDDGVKMRFDAEKIESKPVESALYRIPADYKIISNKEYKELSK